MAGAKGDAYDQGDEGSTVQLVDLKVIQQFSLAVRGATADREAVVAALQADLDHLTGAARTRTTRASSAPAAPRKAPAKTTRARKA